MRYTPEQAYAEDCKRRPLYDDGVQRATWDALSAIAKESWRRNPTPREWRLRDADGERLHACIMLAETDCDTDDETETGETDNG